MHGQNCETGGAIPDAAEDRYVRIDRNHFEELPQRFDTHVECAWINVDKVGVALPGQWLQLLQQMCLKP
jgi:hypothetical protein